MCLLFEITYIQVRLDFSYALNKTTYDNRLNEVGMKAMMSSIKPDIAKI